MDEQTWRHPHRRIRKGRCHCRTEVPVLRRPVGQDDVADRAANVLQPVQDLAGRSHRRMQLHGICSRSTFTRSIQCRPSRPDRCLNNFIGMRRVHTAEILMQI